MIFLGLLVESYGTLLLLQRLVDASKDSDIPKNVPFAFAINNRNTLGHGRKREGGGNACIAYSCTACTIGILKPCKGPLRNCLLFPSVVRRATLGCKQRSGPG